MQIEKITRQGYAATLSKEALWDIFKSMKTQRLLEDRLLKMYKGGQLSGAVSVSYTHLTLPTNREV